MPAFDIVRRWKGRVALDRDGHEIGDPSPPTTVRVGPAARWLLDDDREPS